MELYISADGICHSVYDESVDLRMLGPMEIRRASHVEPTADGHWTVDLSPLNGPILGPFIKRSQALRAEICWLQDWFETLHGD